MWDLEERGPSRGRLLGRSEGSSVLRASYPLQTEPTGWGGDLRAHAAAAHMEGRAHRVWGGTHPLLL